MRTVVAGVALLLATVVGCSSDEPAPVEVGPLASASAGASAEESSPAVSTEVPQTAGPTVPTGGLESAASTREVEATDFVREFFDVVNMAYLRNDAEDVRRLSAPECGSCAAVAKDIERLTARGHAVEGRRYIVSSAEAAPARSDGKVVVDFRFDSDPYTERDADGALVQEYPAERSRDGQVLVDPSRGTFRIAAIRLVDQ